MLKAKPDASNRKIAKQVKVDDKTVAKVRTELESRSEIPNVDTRTDSKGRKQLAKKKRAAVEPVTTDESPATAVPTPDTSQVKSTSRTARWAEATSDALAALTDIDESFSKLQDACAELREIQEEYEEWKDSLPENLQSSAVAEKLEAVCELEIEDAPSALEQAINDLRSVLDDAEAADLPRGFGRD